LNLPVKGPDKDMRSAFSGTLQHQIVFVSSGFTDVQVQSVSWSHSSQDARSGQAPCPFLGLFPMTPSVLTVAHNVERHQASHLVGNCCAEIGDRKSHVASLGTLTVDYKFNRFDCFENVPRPRRTSSSPSCRADMRMWRVMKTCHIVI
jgi:hypothetical protein